RARIPSRTANRQVGDDDVEGVDDAGGVRGRPAIDRHANREHLTCGDTDNRNNAVVDCSLGAGRGPLNAVDPRAHGAGGLDPPPDPPLPEPFPELLGSVGELPDPPPQAVVMRIITTRTSVRFMIDLAKYQMPD